MEKIIKSRIYTECVYLDDGTKTYEKSLWLYTKNYCIIREQVYFDCSDMSNFVKVSNSIWSLTKSASLDKRLCNLYKYY